MADEAQADDGMQMTIGPDLAKFASSLGDGKAAPRWNPPFCGEIDMRIASDGTWYYLGSPIGRKPLVKLFSSVLRREADGGYYLVTPVEKVRIRVDDAPLLAVSMTIDTGLKIQMIRLCTLTGDEVTVGAAHPLRFARDERGAHKPYVMVRDGLEALVARAVFYDLMALGEEHEVDGTPMFGIWSANLFFPIAPMSELAGLV